MLVGQYPVRNLSYKINGCNFHVAKSLDGMTIGNESVAKTVWTDVNEIKMIERLQKCLFANGPTECASSSVFATLHAYVLICCDEKSDKVYSTCIGWKL